MSAPKADLLRLTLHARIEEMSAYIMNAFSPEQVKEVVDAAAERAIRDLPARMAEQADGAVRETARNAINRAFAGIVFDEAFMREVRLGVMRGLVAAATETLAREERQP